MNLSFCTKIHQVDRLLKFAQCQMPIQNRHKTTADPMIRWKDLENENYINDQQPSHDDRNSLAVSLACAFGVDVQANVASKWKVNALFRVHLSGGGQSALSFSHSASIWPVIAEARWITWFALYCSNLHAKTTTSEHACGPLKCCINVDWATLSPATFLFSFNFPFHCADFFFRIRSHSHIVFWKRECPFA